MHEGLRHDDDDEYKSEHLDGCIGLDMGWVGLVCRCPQLEYHSEMSAEVEELCKAD